MLNVYAGWVRMLQGVVSTPVISLFFTATVGNLPYDSFNALADIALP